MNLLKHQFASRLKELRSKAGITQEQLAEKVDISVRSLAYLESGENGCRFSNLQLLAKGVGVEVKDLFDFG